MAAILHQASQAAEWGVDFGPPQIDLQRLRGWKDAVVRRLTGGLGMLSRQRNVDYLQGRGRFIDAHTLHVSVEGELTEVPFDYAVPSPAAPHRWRRQRCKSIRRWSWTPPPRSSWRACRSGCS